MFLDNDKLSALAAAVEEAGQEAFREQSRIHRSYKQDGSIVTEADIRISNHLTAYIHKLFPEAGIISEEEDIPLDRNAEWLFVLDPIDGTDVYSQGLPTYAVSLGILDKDRKPVGAYIAAPRYGVGTESLFIRMDPGKDPYMNGEKLEIRGSKDTITEITMGSKAYRNFDFSAFDGKVRILGSTIIHLLSIVVLPAFEGAIVPRSYAWDIASSHALLRKFGLDLCYSDGSLFEYTDEILYQKKPFKGHLYAGTEKGRAYLMKALPEKIR